MTDFEQLRQTLTQHFQTEWNDYWPIEWQNQTDRIDKSSNWARFSIQEGDRDLASVGTRMTRTYGVVFVQLFVPLESGTKTMAEAAGIVADALDHRTFAPTAELTIETYAARCGPYRTDSGYYTATVSCAWKRDRIKAA